MQELTEKLRNCEDKLLAAEQCKQMLNQELDAVQQAYEKISNDMEVRSGYLSTFFSYSLCWSK